MKSLFAKYMKERENCETLENSQYFCSYRIEEAGIFIADIFVDPQSRDKGLASRVLAKVEKIAKKSNKSLIAGRIDKRAKNFENVKKFTENNGYKMSKEDENSYFVVKVI